MNIYALELNNDIKNIEDRKIYIESLILQLKNPNLVVLPELALCSYIPNTNVWKYADENSVETSKWAMEMALKYCTNIAVGYVEKKDNEYYNSYLIAGHDKVYGIVRKSEPESYIFKSGEFEDIISTPFGKVAVGICYDSRRKHFYDNIKDKEISLILFPHGLPTDPKKQDEEKKNIDTYCNKYLSAFNVPVVFVNSVGILDNMLGKVGKMMAEHEFNLNGMSNIYSNEGEKISSDAKEAIGINVELIPKQITGKIKFYKKDILKGNWIFRKFVLKPDTKKGKIFYEKNKLTKGNT